ncbi:MAG: hypothetical protein KAT43_03360 [Nanoarchaeota archaeon]|nr:hypothetical protein [Nanoarchaeota archaeon]
MTEKKACLEDCHGLITIMYRISNPSGEGILVDSATLMTMPCAGNPAMNPGCEIPIEERFVTYEIADLGRNNFLIRKTRLEEAEVTAEFQEGTLDPPTQFFRQLTSELAYEVSQHGHDLKEAYSSRMLPSKEFVDYLRRLFIEI